MTYFNPRVAPRDPNRRRTPCRQWVSRCASVGKAHHIKSERGREPWWRVTCSCGVKWVGTGTEEEIAEKMMQHLFATMDSP